MELIQVIDDEYMKQEIDQHHYMEMYDDIMDKHIVGYGKLDEGIDLRHEQQNTC